jgi:poly(A) polymerase/tRNA nucleotidyltransferase (CCA-adding enzyme)
MPEYVQRVGKALIDAGFKCYLVGGAVRDIALGKEPNDFDLASDALPEEVMKIFPKSVSVGAKFGTVIVLSKDEEGENMEVEVTTFRSESDYVDGRWPSKVEFVKEIDKDLGRRDFTINAMALDLSSNELDLKEDLKEWNIYDPFDGQRDLDMKLIRAVGTPIERFKEDGLRAFKACRLAAQLQFEIEKDTLEAIKEAIPVAEQVSMERIRDEFMKMLLKSPQPSVGIDLMRETELLQIFIPELLEGYGIEQKLFHTHDVYWHALRTCDVAHDSVKLAALFHDIGKARTDMGNGHFYGHDRVSAEMAEDIMKRMKFSNTDIQKVSILIRNHMFYYPHLKEDMSKEEKENIEMHKWTDSAVRRFVQRVGEENIEDLFRLRIADAESNPNSDFKPEEITELQKRISKVLEEDMAFKVTDLKITGEDLASIGIEKGPEMGKILHELLEMALDDPLVNTKERLLEEAKILKQEDEKN